MAATNERIIADPTEVSTGRTPLDLTPWLNMDGLDWGDAAIAAFMSESTVGEVPVDYRIPNREVSGGLMFGSTKGGTTAQQARSAIQSKVALWQREGGWIKRVTNNGGTVYADVVDATMHATSAPGFLSSQGFDIDASLSMSLVPEFYGNEVQLADHAETSAAELIFTETTIEGDMPARVRVVVDNDQASAQESLIWGFRARNHDSTTTARIAWEAEAFTNLASGASRAALSGASGGSVVAGTATASYTDIMSEWGFTHQGHYRVFARVYSSSAAAANIWVRWRYSTDGLNTFTYNDEVKVTGGSIFQLVDLGQVDVRKPPVGTGGWQGYAQARGSAGTENIRFDRIWFCPVDEYSGVIRASALPASDTANELRTEGYFQNQSGRYDERPIWGDLPRLPVPKQSGGTVEVFIKASRGTIGSVLGPTSSADAGIDDISARITYRPSWLFVDDT